MDLQLADNAALVTASSAGLGKASAKALAREDANVVINGRDEDKLTATQTELNAVGNGDIVAVQGDITDPGVPTELVDRTVAEFGGLDHLVTSAGGPPSGAFLDLPEEEWHDAFELLVMSVVRLIHESADQLKADGGGTIVNITSRSVKEAIGSLVLSNAVRMAVIGLEKTLSRELAPDVRVNAVLPGPHETDRVSDLIEQAVERGEYDSYEDGLRSRGESVPLGRIGDPIELGDTVAFLSSPRSGFITGTAVVIDGGLGRANM